MPETASTRTTDRDRLRSRLVSPRSTAKGTSTGVSPSETAQSSTEQASTGRASTEPATRATPYHPRATQHAGMPHGRPAQFEQSPVLFRLPAIAPAELGATAGASEPTYSESFRSVQSQPCAVRSDDDVALDIARVDPQVVSQAPDSQPPGQVSFVHSEISEPSAEVIVSQPQAALPQRQAPSRIALGGNIGRAAWC